MGEILGLLDQAPRQLTSTLETVLHLLDPLIDLVLGPVLGSRWWNWKFREKHFWNPNPELLLHSSYGFWPYLSTSSNDWDLASTLPWKNCENRKDAFPGIFNFTVGILIVRLGTRSCINNLTNCGRTGMYCKIIIW